MPFHENLVITLQCLNCAIVQFLFLFFFLHHNKTELTAISISRNTIWLMLRIKLQRNIGFLEAFLGRREPCAWCFPFCLTNPHICLNHQKNASIFFVKRAVLCFNREALSSSLTGLKIVFLVLSKN